MYWTYHIISNETFHCIFRESKLLKIEHTVPRSYSWGFLLSTASNLWRESKALRLILIHRELPLISFYWYERTKVRKCSFCSTNWTEIIKLARAGRKLKVINSHFVSSLSNLACQAAIFQFVKRYWSCVAKWIANINHDNRSKLQRCSIQLLTGNCNDCN